MIAILMVMLGTAFFVGIGVGCWSNWMSRRQLLDQLANTEDELQAARDSQQYWFREYQILVRSLQIMRHNEGDWWKYGD